MKHKLYIITEHLTVQEITDLINRAYDDGYSHGFSDGECKFDEGYGKGVSDGYGDGYKAGFEAGKNSTIPKEWRIDPKDAERWIRDYKKITIPETPIIYPYPSTPVTPVTPNDWPPSVIYCNSGDVPEAHYGDGKIHDVKVGDVETGGTVDG